MKKREACSKRQRQVAAYGAVTFCLSWAALPARAAEPTDAPKAPEAPRAPVTRGPVPKIMGPYKLQPGDEIQINVTPRGKEYDCRGVVLPDGMLNLNAPFGVIKAGGMTIEDLQETLINVLKSKKVGLKDPTVSINPVHLAEPEKPEKIIGKVTVVGAVGRPGPLDLDEGLRLRKAIDLAGGVMKEGDLKGIRLFHKDLKLEIVDLSTDDLVKDPKNNRLLQDGDSINIPALPPMKEIPDTVSLSGAPGALMASGPFELSPAKLSTLQDLLSGKLTPVADFKHVKLQREGEGEQVYDLQALSEKGLQGNVLLKPNDKIFVGVQTNQLFLVGAVPKPGAYGMQPGQHLSEFFLRPKDPEVAAALGSAVDLEHVRVVRVGEPAMEVNLKAIFKELGKKQTKVASNSPKNDVALQPGDSILILPREEKQKHSFYEYFGQIGGLAGLFAAF